MTDFDLTASQHAHTPSKGEEAQTGVNWTQACQQDQEGSTHTIRLAQRTTRELHFITPSHQEEGAGLCLSSTTKKKTTKKNNHVRWTASARTAGNLHTAGGIGRLRPQSCNSSWEEEPTSNGGAGKSHHGCLNSSGNNR